AGGGGGLGGPWGHPETRTSPPAITNGGAPPASPRERRAMASTGQAAVADNHIGLLDKERIIAPLNYNRWLVPPAALAIHLCIGMAYGFSVFWVPLGRALGVAAGTGKPIVCPG